MRFSFPHSHACHRGRVRIEDEEDEAPNCAIEFGDGTTIIGKWRRTGDAIDLTVPPYRTAKGTAIQAKRWLLARDRDGEWRSERADKGPPDRSPA